MEGIVSCGAHVPRFRISRKTISAAMRWLNQSGLPGEKAVAGYDEDSLTMAVGAGMDCIGSFDSKKIDGVYFATTTAPYRERESAAIIATALAVPAQVQTADLGDSLKAGTNALLMACGAVKSGIKSNVLVCASDSRIGKPGSSQEATFGDAGAALLIGSEGVIASFEGSFSVSYDFPDHFRAAMDKFDRGMEDRWIRDEAYTKFIPEALNGLMKKYHLEPTQIAKVVYPCLYAREFETIGKKLGFTPQQIQNSILATVGEAGNTSALLMLIAALEEAKPGDNILVASHGNGSEALWFKATPEIVTKQRPWVKRCIDNKKELTNYEQFLTFKGILPVEIGLRGEVGTTMVPLTWRERKVILSLIGSKCKICGTPQYPTQRICVNSHCGAVDQMEDYKFSDKKGVLFSYTADNLAATFNPPQLYGAVDFEGGGRQLFEIADCEADNLKVGMPVKMTFRRKYVDEGRGIIGYGWKARPANE